jgi:patatin-like phospholipase/acyl hydrolase
VGTSIGGIISMAAANGIKMEEVVKHLEQEFDQPNIFIKNERTVFSTFNEYFHDWFNKYIPILREGVGIASVYKTTGLKNLLTQLLGEKTIKEGITHVGVTAAEFSHFEDPQGVLFTNIDDQYKDIMMVDAVVSSGAAPYYFTPHSFHI